MNNISVSLLTLFLVKMKKNLYFLNLVLSCLKVLLSSEIKNNFPKPTQIKRKRLEKRGENLALAILVNVSEA